MKIICTTSNRYLHLIPVFIYLFNKYWPDQELEIVGYARPQNLPDDVSFYSMGTQGDVSEWSTDLRKYFEQQDEWFVWVMEDTFLKAPVNEELLDMSCALMMPGIGRIDLTCDIMKRAHTVTAGDIAWASPTARYRLSTQPSIWNRDFLLKYLTDGLTPWQFEVQDAFNNEWNVVGLTDRAVIHNEGVRKHDPHTLDLTGMSDEDLEIIKGLI